MTAKDLFDLSGIQEDPNFLEMDYAVPFEHEKKQYPYNGRAITVYWRDGKCEIISHYELACRAKKQLQVKFKEMMNKLASYDIVSQSYRLEIYRTYCLLEDSENLKRDCFESQNFFTFPAKEKV